MLFGKKKEMKSFETYVSADTDIHSERHDGAFNAYLKLYRARFPDCRPEEVPGIYGEIPSSLSLSLSERRLITIGKRSARRGRCSN